VTNFTLSISRVKPGALLNALGFLLAWLTNCATLAETQLDRLNRCRLSRGVT
jgi:hypothetical protein